MENIRFPRVLLVDDDEAVRDVLRRMLAVDKVSVDCEDSGAHALERLRHFEYDAVLCDMWMPGMNGKEVFERIEVEFPGLRDRFVFLTGDIASEFTWDLIEERHLPYVLKPVDQAQLRQKLHDVVQGECDTQMLAGDKRRDERVPVDTTAQVRYAAWANAQAEIVQVTNASEEGFYFVTRRTYRPEMDLLMRFGRDRANRPEVPARVVRVDELGDGRLGVAVTLKKARASVTHDIQ